MPSTYEMAAVAFITQFLFIGLRTWNVKMIASGNMALVALSGLFVHLSWLVGVTIGVTTITEITENYKTEYLIVIIASAMGGILGAHMAMSFKGK